MSSGPISGFITPKAITTMRSSSQSLGLGILAICINVSLMIIKIGVGVVGNSYALIADGIESASDIFSSVVTWAGSACRSSLLMTTTLTDTERLTR